MAQVSARSILALLIAVLVISVRSLSASPDNRGYKHGDYIPLFANKVYPPNDQCQASPYFELPFCPPGSPIKNRMKSFEEILEGDCFTNTRYRLNFKVGKTGETLCEKILTIEEVGKFRHAIHNDFELQMYYNNIQMRGEIGKVEEDARYYLVKHIDFYAYYLRDQVQEVYLKSDFSSAVDITDDAAVKVNFTYSVFWKSLKHKPTDSVLLNETLVEQGEGVSIFSFLLLTCTIVAWVGLLVAVSLLYLRSYLNRYWSSTRQIHGDGCRCPPYSSLLGAILGIGNQLLILVGALFLVAYSGDRVLPCNHGQLALIMIPSYTLTSLFSGYTATSFHTHYTVIGWRECVIQTGVLYFFPAFLTVVFMNALAQITLGISDLPEFGTMVTLFVQWGTATIAFLGVGGVIGYVCRPQPPSPCATSRIRRVVPVPQLSWYMRTPAQMFLGGLLPFLLMFGEMDALYASLWTQRVCGTFSSMWTAFIRLILITIVSGFIFTQSQLSNLQDAGWWWRSLLRGGSTAIFMFAYGIYFHVRANKQLEIMKLLLFLGYNACMFYALFLILGTIGFYSSSFVFRPTCREHLKNK